MNKEHLADRLMSLNDDGKSFDEIADYLESLMKEE